MSRVRDSTKLSEFLRVPYHENSSNDTIKLCTEFNKDQGIPQFESAPNVVQVRTKKYRQWLSHDPLPARKATGVDMNMNMIHLRLESLYDYGAERTFTNAKDLQGTLIGNELSDRCVPILEGGEFREISQYTNWDKKKRLKGYNPMSENEEALKRFSKSDICFILSQLDLEFEQQIGYRYDNVLSMLKA